LKIDIELLDGSALQAGAEVFESPLEARVAAFASPSEAGIKVSFGGIDSSGSSLNGAIDERCSSRLALLLDGKWSVLLLTWPDLHGSSCSGPVVLLTELGSRVLLLLLVSSLPD